MGGSSNFIGLNTGLQTTCEDSEKCYGHKLLGERWIGNSRMELDNCWITVLGSIYSFANSKRLPFVGRLLLSWHLKGMEMGKSQEPGHQAWVGLV